MCCHNVLDPKPRKMVSHLPCCSRGKRVALERLQTPLTDQHFHSWNWFCTTFLLTDIYLLFSNTITFKIIKKSINRKKGENSTTLPISLAFPTWINRVAYVLDTTPSLCHWSLWNIHTSTSRISYFWRHSWNHILPGKLNQSNRKSYFHHDLHQHPINYDWNESCFVFMLCGFIKKTQNNHQSLCLYCYWILYNVSSLCKHMLCFPTFLL